MRCLTPGSAATGAISLKNGKSGTQCRPRHGLLLQHHDRWMPGPGRAARPGEHGAGTLGVSGWRGGAPSAHVSLGPASKVTAATG